jgi:hypothetical protein
MKLDLFPSLFINISSTQQIFWCVTLLNENETPLKLSLREWPKALSSIAYFPTCWHTLSGLGMHFGLVWSLIITRRRLKEVWCFFSFFFCCKLRTRMVYTHTHTHIYTHINAHKCDLTPFTIVSAIRFEYVPDDIISYRLSIEIRYFITAFTQRLFTVTWHLVG